MRTLIPTVLLLLTTALPVTAADYWPDDAPRTYVFGEAAEQIRFVVEPGAGDAVTMRIVSVQCDIRWSGTLASDGTLGVETASLLCTDVVDPVLDLTFAPGTLLFDPTKIGGPIQAFAATSETAEFVVSVRLGAPRTIQVGDRTYEAVLFEMGIQDPFLVAPLVSVDVNVDAGPVRVNGLDRTAVIEGIVDQAPGSWSGLKARY